MRVLLDTRVLIWAVTDPKRLFRSVRALLADAATSVLVSSASA